MVARRQVSSTSSGFVIDFAGGRYILTNAHSVDYWTQVRRRCSGGSRSGFAGSLLSAFPRSALGIKCRSRSSAVGMTPSSWPRSWRSGSSATSPSCRSSLPNSGRGSSPSGSGACLDYRQAPVAVAALMPLFAPPARLDPCRPFTPLSAPSCGGAGPGVCDWISHRRRHDLSHQRSREQDRGHTLLARIHGAAGDADRCGHQQAGRRRRAAPPSAGLASNHSALSLPAAETRVGRC